jgi:hypothetical protein
LLEAVERCHRPLSDYVTLEDGPLIIPCSSGASITFHGWVPGAGTGTAVLEMIQTNWLTPSSSPLESDIKSAFETAWLGKEFHENLAESGHQLTSALIFSIQESSVIQREAVVYGGKRILKDPLKTAAWDKQFPVWSLNHKGKNSYFKFNKNSLIQGSPISPVFYVSFLISKLWTSKISLVIFGDNIYHLSSSVGIPGMTIKTPVPIFHGTLGLGFVWKSGRLHVTAPHKGYAEGVNRLLVQYYNSLLPSDEEN